ncbi:HEAT repeat domain-containing protein [Sorangium atrum]|uniref:HEAT repeat domain-containing protein n=1 Tax=Sorangium atrum TaxID=2995308 RepID=A0ABT5C800_9BACT|nr:HEAT repeat domain-containing protein [Sorangium aterium]MDC0682561.1 HEAT repeat domain-containing protein [Sorangium aterium]
MSRSPFRFRRPRLGAAAGLIAASAAVGGSAAAQVAPVVLPHAAGQQALAVRIDAGGVTARACPAAAACAPDGGKVLAVPSEVAPLLGGARVVPVTLADGKRLAKIEVPAAGKPAGVGAPEGAGGSWVMLLAAPLAGKGTEPLVLWSGWTGVATGEHGEGRSDAVVVEPLGSGNRVLVGQLRDDVTLCGRPALVGASEVDPRTMTLLKGASFQNLPAEERRAAGKVVAERRDADAPAATFRLLRPTAASSAVGKRFAEIADGDPKTAWSEGKVGAGRGEFVSFSSADEVGITGLGLRIKPSDGVEGGAAPRTLFVATPDRLFQVSLPEDAWLKESAGYEVKLPEEIKASCIAVVLDDAYAPAGAGSRGAPSAPEVRVTIAEVTARTAFDGQGPAALVGALAGGGERSRAAAALLARGGPEAVEAAIAGYDRLDPAGRQLARGVIDTAPCAVQIPFLTARLASGAASAAQPAPGAASAGRVSGMAAALGRAPRAAPPEPDPELHHARDRIRRCGRAAAPALAEIVKAGAPAARVVAARELALVAPVEAIPALLDALAGARGAARRELRAALALAARSERAASVVEEEMQLERLRARPEDAQLDLLRALGPALGRVKGGGAAFQALASAGGAPFDRRYLLQAPAAALARAGEAPAEAYLRASLRKDADAHVRLRAAEVTADVPALAPDLLAAASDPEARVREAAIVALARAASAGAKLPAGAGEALAARLTSDPWTFIRGGAALAIGAMPATTAGDRALVGALADSSPEVRQHALDGLGAHRATAHIEAVRDRAEDKEEDVEVRARAILALGAMCDASSVDLWTRLALRAKSPIGEHDQRLGSAALAALGSVHPADLPARLKPLLDKGTPHGLREAARAALSAPPQCRRR